MTTVRVVSATTLLVLLIAGCSAQVAPSGAKAPAVSTLAPPPVPAPVYSPLLEYIYDPVNNLTTFGNAINVGNVQQYLNNSKLAITLFAPVDSAWVTCLDTLTSELPITEQQFFSPFNSFTLGAIIQNHIIQIPYKYGPLTSTDSITTLTNLCSNAKNLNVTVDKTSKAVTLRSSGGFNATLIGTGLVVGNVVVYPIDNCLMPDKVSLTYQVALTGSSFYQDSCEQQLQAVCESSGGALAPAPVPASTASVSTSSLP